jgi:lipoprotein NlpI
MARAPSRPWQGLVLAGLGLVAAAVRAEDRGRRQLFNDAVRLLFAGKPADSAKDFDALVAVRPELEPQLWQRGLALYYAGRFADGRRQFEVHRGANPADVENVAWHFACAARQEDPAAARKALLPVGDDDRVPMREILALFRGTGTPAEVLAAAEAGPEDVRRNQLCYAHLYLGLYAESTGDMAEAKTHIVLAAGRYSMDHFMGKIARLHATLRDWDVPADDH